MANRSFVAESKSFRDRAVTVNVWSQILDALGI